MIRTLVALRPPVDIDGPRVRLALVWAAVVVLAVLAGAATSAFVFAGVAVGAAGQACRSWRRAEQRPYRPVAIGGAVVIALAGGAGPLAVPAAAVLVTIASVVVVQTSLGGTRFDARLTAAIALVVGVGAAVVPLARAELGTTPVLVLVASVFASEASGFLVGAGARTPYEAPAASVVAVAVVTVATAAVLAPPFRGASPWMLGALVAALVPLGPRVASALLPDPAAFAPALRRLDAFIAIGPVWVLVASLTLDLP